MAKRYLTWAYNFYYPSGPELDYVGDFDTPEEAELRGIKMGKDRVNVFDTKTATWLDLYNK